MHFVLFKNTLQILFSVDICFMTFDLVVMDVLEISTSRVRLYTFDLSRPDTDRSSELPFMF